MPLMLVCQSHMHGYKNKKLRYREEHSASVVLGVLHGIYREKIC